MVHRWPFERYDAKRALSTAVALAVAALLAAVPQPSAEGAPPDGRAWELVSPGAKLGNDVMPSSSRTRASAVEAPGLPMAAAFTSLGGFADVRGTGIATEYLAQRTGAPGTSGWTTHAITPLQEPLSLGAVGQQLEPAYEGDMSPDLTTGVFRAWSPVTGAPNVAQVENLYLRRDLRMPGIGAYGLLTDAFAPLPAIARDTDRPYLAAVSDDFEHVLFESRLALTPDAGAAGNVKLYKADHGVVRLVAAAPDCPAAFGPASAMPCSIAGLGAAALRHTERALSADGSRTIFGSPVIDANVSTSARAPGRLWQLDDGGTATTADDVLIPIDASEKAAPDPPKPARFQTASADGSRILFTSDAQLTDAPGSGLYVWEREPDADGHHLTLIGGGAQTAAVGASRDADRVYFVAPVQLVPGGPAVRERAAYLWEADADGGAGGTLSYVAPLSVGDATVNTNATPWNLTQVVSRVNPDGRRLLLTLSEGDGLPPAYDHGSCPDGNADTTSNGRCSEVYVYRAERSTPLAPDLACVSCRPDGEPATASAYVNVREAGGAAQLTWHMSHALSDDGRRVFFSTAEPLVPADVNQRSDAYVYDVQSDAVGLLSSGRDSADSFFLDASANGDDAFFATRERLVGWDTDQSYDLYDARVGGGFPEPPAPPAGCAGEACRGEPSAPPPVAATGSPAVKQGNVAARVRARARRCRRGRVKKRVRGKLRCVKRARGRRR